MLITKTVTRTAIICPTCGYEWIPYTISPKQCPKCHYRLDYQPSRPRHPKYYERLKRSTKRRDGKGSLTDREFEDKYKATIQEINQAAGCKVEPKEAKIRLKKLLEESFPEGPKLRSRK